MKPPFPYYGAKVRLAPWIVNLLPAHTHYVEPFAGSLAVLLTKTPSRMETVNDLDRELMTFWRVLRDREKDLEQVCARTPHSRAEHQNAFTPATDDLEVARRVWVRLTQGRSARLTPTGWRWQARDNGCSTMPEYLAAYRSRITTVAERLQRVTLECREALDVIADYGQHPDVLMYVDPPYEASTRNGTNYRHEMPKRREHEHLAAALRTCAGAVVLSGYPSDLYDIELYPDWHRYEMAAQTAQGGKGSPRTEVLWSNRPLGAQLDLFDLGGAA